MEPQSLSLQSSSAQEGLRAHRASVAQFAELINSGRPQRPWSLSGSICRALQLSLASAPKSSTAQLGLNAHEALVVRFTELISSRRPQCPWSLSGSVCRAHQLNKALAPKSLSSSVCRALQLRKASAPTEPQQLSLTSSTAQLRPCSPRVSSAQGR